MVDVNHQLVQGGGTNERCSSSIFPSGGVQFKIIEHLWKEVSPINLVSLD